MTATKQETEQAVNRVEKLTDEAIAKRLSLIGRLIKTRAEKRDEIQAEIDGLVSEKSELIQLQIDRLKAQLEPAKEQE